MPADPTVAAQAGAAWWRQGSSTARYPIRMNQAQALALLLVATTRVGAQQRIVLLEQGADLRLQRRFGKEEEQAVSTRLRPKHGQDGQDEVGAT